VFNINQPEIAQPLIFVIEYALAKLLMHWGIKPRSMIGYSFGEYVAAAAAGVFSPGEALTLAVFRGQLLRQIPAGAMLSVPLTTKEVEPLLRTPGTDDNGQLSIGIDNGPSCVVSGSTAAIDAFEKQMKEKRCMCMRVDQSRALHSKMMDPIAAEFREKVAGFTLNKPKIPYISNVTGQWITGEEATDPAYWAKHLKQTVRFADGMKELLKKKNSILIEIGPGRDMSTLAIRYLDNHPGHQVLNLLRHPHQNVSDDYFLLNKIGRLWLYGQPIDWNGFYGEEKRRRIPLPTYPFEGQRFWIDKTELNQGAEILSQKPRLHRKSDLADWFYIPSWKRSRPFSHEPWEIPGGSYWLIFMDECGLGKQLKEQLEKKNPKDHHVIGVNVGTEFEKVNHRLYTINPQEDNHYALLFHQLCAASGIPDKIVHLWSITANENETLGINSIENVLDSGFYSLLNIAKAIGEQNLNKDIQIDVVSNKMQEVTGKDGVCPQKALILGPVRSIPGEYKNLSCRSIDVTLPGPGTSDEEKLVNQLLKEFTTGNPDKTQIIAYRDNHRWVQVFEPVQLEQSNKKASRLKEGGVYLITGGLGGIGLAMAEYLAKNVKARLVLTGRTPLPPRNQWQQWLKTESNSENEPVIQKIRKILDLEKSGSQVLVFSAEVENPEQMQAVINRAEEHFGGFNGVIHSAGTADGAMIQLRTRETSEQVFLAKIRGTLVLDRLLKGTPLDFFILCSSIGSVLTQIGQVGYCAANCFLDAYAHSKFYQHGTFTSINWDRWQNVGIATIIEKQHKQLTGEELTGGITPGEGVEALARILAEPLPQVIVSTRELEPLIEQFKGINASSLMKSLAGVSESKAVYQRPDLDTEYAAPRDETQQTVANIWQNFFGFEQIGIHDDFFELGGDSLKAMVVLSKIHKEFDVEIPINEIFTRPTIEKLSEYMNSADKSAYFSIEPAEKKEYYPLSSSQKRLYVLQQMQKNSTAYNESQVVVYEPGPGEQVLVNAFKKLIRRHESLRTSFQMNGDKPVQRIHDDVPFDLENYEPGRDLPGNHDLIRRFIRPFDLSRAPLLRAWIIKTNPQKYILIVDLHHIITDGTSNRLLWKEFTALHQERELPGLRIQYKDYAQWFNSKQRQSGRINHEKYWLSALAGELPVLDLPTDYPRPDQQSYEGKIQGFAIGKEETQALKNPAPGEDITLYMKLLAIFNVFLYQLTGQEDIIVGTPTAGRRHADLEHIIGMFVNTLPIRNYPQPEKTFSQFLKEVKKHSLASYENQDYAFEDLIDKLNVQRDVSRNPVFDVFFIFQSQENGKEGENREKTFITDTFQDYQPAIAKFDMTLYVNEYSERITFGIEYCVKLFKDETIRRYTGYIKKIISSIITEVHRELRTIDMISADEKNRLLNVFNHTAADYPGEKTIDQLFHDQERQTPGYIAVKGKSAGKFPGDISLTYRTLARYSGHLARLLRERGLRPGMRVGVIMERRVEIMAVLLGILEARGAYLPIDPGYPAKRIDYMLKDSGVNVQITTDMLPELLALDPGSPAAAAVPTAKSSTVPLAYVIYTSGSTGNPKGIAITHRNLVNFIASMTAVIDFSPGKAILALTTICFDIFFLETLLPVTCGLKVVIAGENQQKSPAMLQNLIIKNSMNMIQVTPPRLRLLLEFANHGKWPGHIREILVGGEAFPPPLLRQLKEVYPGKIYNVYGPTETTIWSTVKDLTHCTPPELNIGKPIFNTQIYIVNRFNRVQPLGAAGELLIGGDGVALGYLNNVALTAEKFILATKTQRHKDVYFSWCLGALVAKLYKTGDLARWLSPGEVEFLGRQDQQVKIRGYRIELKEIENQLLKHEEIKEAVLFAGTNKTGDQYICAYLVPRHGENRGETPGLDIMELRKQIAVKLPGYMIPSYFVLLEKIPITPNGKLDRSALPGPGEALVDTTTYAAPQSSNEKILAQIWKEVLQIEKVGIYDNFFNLGGNSLNVLRLNQRLLETFSREIPVTEMFRNLTIRFLDQYLGEDNHMQTKKISEEENKQAAALEEAKMTFKETMSKFKDEEAV
jgi:iturin family lipopeptide synthetase A